MRLRPWSSGIHRLRTECEQRLADLPVPYPFTVPTLIANMEQARGRRIQLLRVDDPRADMRTACGLRAKGASMSIVLYRGRPTPNQVEHVIVHELAHEWLDHGATLSAADVGKLLSAATFRAVTDALGPDAVIQGRTRYVSREEREAELSASLIRRKSLLQQPMGTDPISLLEATLSHPMAVPRRRSSRGSHG